MKYIFFLLQYCKKKWMHIFEIFLKNDSIQSNLYSSKKFCLLTKRQAEILSFVADGLTNKEIAVKLDISVKTVETHLTRIYKILETDGRVGAIVKYTRNNNYRIL